MHLVRELLLLAVAVVGWAGAPWLTGTPVPAASAVVFALPFQAGYALASLAGQRAPAWVLAMLGAGLWAWGLAPGALAGAGFAVALAAAPVLLALGAGLRRGARAGAAALYLWAVTFVAVRAGLLALVPAGTATAPRLALAGVGALYLTLRLLAAVVYPLAVDPWFRKQPQP